MSFYMKPIAESIAGNLVELHSEGETIEKAKYYKEVITENIIPEGKRSIKSEYTFYTGKTAHQFKVEQLFKKRR